MLCSHWYKKILKKNYFALKKSLLLWGHILPYPKDELVQPKLSSLGGDNFSFLTRHLTDGLQAEHG